METARQVIGYVGGTLVIPQTVLVREYWRQIRAGLAAADIPTRHIVLHAEVDTLIGRIECDTAANRQWRLDHLARYQQALDWLAVEAEMLDTTGRAPRDIVEMVISAR